MRAAKRLGRATLVNLLPAALLLLLMVTLIGSGAPGDPQLDHVLRTFDALKGGRLAALALAVLGLAVILQPFQVAIVQLLEGYWTISPMHRVGSESLSGRSTSAWSCSAVGAVR